MTEYTLIRFIIIMMTINVGLGLYDVAVLSYNPEYESTIDFSSSPAAAYANGSLSNAFNADEGDVMPESATSVDSDTGNVFTDAWSSMSNWWTKQQTRFKLLTSILTQPYGFLKDMGVPQQYATAFGILWFSIMGVLIVSYIRSGSGG